MDNNKTEVITQLTYNVDYMWYAVMIIGFFIVIYLDSKAYPDNKEK